EDPYGSVTVAAPDWSARSSSSFSWNYLHQGGKLDGVTGLYSFRNRDYSPVLGRWSQVDPLAYDARDSNLYRYVRNDPTNRMDPSGLQDEKLLPAPDVKFATFGDSYNELSDAEKKNFEKLIYDDYGQTKDILSKNRLSLIYKKVNPP